ncbi:MAG TPA: DUF2189 domain-containing protein [Burkholderiales bacterium]|jgi:uncharacterized membrane protein|nr:DUF2189 domain-containing protein [Burkholderiales bacterium]
MDKPMDAFAHSPGLPGVVRVGTLQPLHWLARGWRDFTANPGPSVAHGLILVALGWLIVLMCSTQIDLLAAAVSGFLLVGPVFGAGFYELSRLRASGQRATFDASLDGALRNGRSLARLGLLLAILAVAWVLISRLLFVQALGGTLPSVRQTFYQTIIDWDYYEFFVIYLSTGAVFAVVAFIVSAMSAPMIFDRAAGTRTAILTSIKAVGTNPSAMIVWAALIAGLTAIGFATLLFGLVIVLPVVGHATWHAYRDLIR